MERKLFKNLICTSKEMRVVLRKRQRTHTSPHFCPLLHLHRLNRNFSNRSITSSHKEVPVRKDAK